MSWLFSRALVEEFLEGNSSDGVQSVLLNGSNTPPAYLCNDKTEGSFRLSRYGMTLEPLTETLGEELLTWFREDSLAKTSVPPTTTEKGLTEKDQDFGLSSSESLAKLDPSGCWLKTQPTSEPRVLDEFSKTWPASGMMLHGGCYRRKTVEPITSGSECGLLPAPLASDGKFAGHSVLKRLQSKRQISLSHFVQMFPTPTAHNAKEGGYPAEGNRNTPTLGWVVGGKINPQFTEWMMGWPIGWTDLKPLEMGKFQSWQQQHSHS